MGAEHLVQGAGSEINLARKAARRHWARWHAIASIAAVPEIRQGLSFPRSCVRQPSTGSTPRVSTLSETDQARSRSRHSL